MKLLKILFAVLAILSLIAVYPLYYYANKIFVFDHLVLGYPEMFMCVSSYIVWMSALMIITEIQHKKEFKKCRLVLEIQEKVTEEAKKMLFASQKEKEEMQANLMMISSKEKQELIEKLQKDYTSTKSHRICELEEALHSISEKHQLALETIEEQRKTINEMNIQKATGYFPIKGFHIFEPTKIEKKSKPKKSKKK